MTDPWPRIHPNVRRRQRRLRTAGALILAAGVAAAILTYRIGKAHAAPTIEELLPGTTAAVQRQRGLLYGDHIAGALAWLDYFQSPEGAARLIVAVAAFCAALCFYVAWRIKENG